MLRRILLPLGLILIFLLIYSKYASPPQTEDSSNLWVTFKKHGEQIVSYPSDIEELEQLRKLPPSPPPKKESSLSATHPSPPSPLKYDDKWKKKLAKTLLARQETDTRVLIKDEGSIISKDGKRETLAIHTTITYLLPDNSTSSFNALIEAETGKVLKTWNRVKHEKLRQRQGFSLEDSN